MILFVTFTASVLIAAAAAAADHPHKHLKTLADDCRFALADRKFDLCPLFTGQRLAQWSVHYTQQTPPSVTTTLYQFSLAGPLKRNASLPDDEQCAEGTWVCMKTINRRPQRSQEPPRVTQLIPVVAQFEDASLASAAGREDFGIYAQFGYVRGDQSAPLWLSMSGGYYVDKPQRLLFNLMCAPDNQEPTYGWSWNGTHTFDWKTRHACANVRATPSPYPPTPPDDPAPVIDAPPADELITPPPVSPRMTARAVTTILFCTIAALFGVAYVTLHPPEFVRSFRIRRLRTRVSADKLLRWADEDLALMEVGEEDEMVNAHVDNEQIPLKPSPKLGFANYGSAKRSGL
ncbi:hypothetical protein BV25DRAFT_1878067 [Artomyces pyxidatus]|uniref:Uncharacterized protein n=1 Tax=Artomyces pyxidatus TaxID=48021 RepID=A0ACB8TF24_9AGAM|nr:hypothetical protein BV25DRAFT_1878067 [Artomyces pyxidatus]